MRRKTVNFRNIPITEVEIQNQILQYLTLCRIFAWRQNCGAFVMENQEGERRKKRFIRCGIQGISDIIGILPDGRFLAIEVKRPGRKPTKAQESFLKEIARNGGVAIVAYSVEDVERTLKAEGVNKNRRGNKIEG